MDERNKEMIEDLIIFEWKRVIRRYNLMLNIVNYQHLEKEDFETEPKTIIITS